MATRTRAALVIGGTGFLGRHICARLVASGWRVMAVARTPGTVPDGVRMRPLNLAAGPAAVAPVLAAERPALVVNAAGAVWRVGAAQFVAANETLVESLLSAIEAAPGRPRLVQLGSSLEYGPTVAGRPIGEDTPARPDSPYGCSKLRATEAVLAAARGGAVDGVVLRLFNAIGPGLPPMSLAGSVVAHLAAATYARPDGTRVAPDGPPVTLTFASLHGARDYVDARDVADAVERAARAAPSGALVNIGRGVAVPARLLVETLVAAAGIPARIVDGSGTSTADSPDDRAARTGGVDWQQADIGRARALLDWVPRWGLADSLRDTFAAARPPHDTPR